MLRVMGDAVYSPSFLPSMEEVNHGIRWLRRHPILGGMAVVAATAVSVYGWVRSEDTELEVVESEDRGKAVEKVPSDGHIGRSVSWSDQHGGSLTEILGSGSGNEAQEKSLQAESKCIECGQIVASGVEEKRGVVNAQDDESSGQFRKGEARALLCRDCLKATWRERDIVQGEETRAFRQTPESEGCAEREAEKPGIRLCSSKRNIHSPFQVDVHPVERNTGQDEDVGGETVSPQWGWYVSITPPREEFARTTVT